MKKDKKHPLFLRLRRWAIRGICAHFLLSEKNKISKEYLVIKK